jgi:hemerythrin-like domain-containing protein
MHDEVRRRFVLGAAGAGFLLVSRVKLADARGPKAGEGKECGNEEEVSPPEDLMREHGVLNRILLIYEEGIRRLDAQQPLAIDVLASGADLIHRFIEQYHEKLEEDHVFPLFEKANKLVDLVTTLRHQHRAGRGLTDTVLRLAHPRRVQNAGDRHKLVETLRLFIRMYRPHEAREDTVLFPAFRSVVTPVEFAALGEQFEDKEHELFGPEGFEGIVAQVAKLEQALGIADLSQFTPPAA